MRHKVTVHLLYKRTSMNIINSLQTGLLLHLIGLTLLVGATLSSYIVQRQFRKEYKDQQKGLALMHSSKKLRHLAAIGLGLQVVSGVMMLAATGGGYGQQLWFKIKMVLVLLIIAVTIAWHRSLQNRLHQLVLNDEMNAHKNQQIEKIAVRINYAQLSLLAFFIIIFILSVFRFT